MTHAIVNKVTKFCVTSCIVIGIVLLYVHQIRYGIINKKTYTFFELSIDYRNYTVIKKSTQNDSCYYLELQSPIDTKETEVVRVKDYVYLRTFVNEVIK